MQDKAVRLVGYITESKRRKLKAALALQGLGLTEWLNLKIDEEIAAQNT